MTNLQQEFFPMQTKRYLSSSDDDDIEMYDITITEFVFDFQPGQKAQIITDAFPGVGQFIAIKYDGKDQIARYGNHSIQLKDGNRALQCAVTILGVVKVGLYFLMAFID